ncbi:hypothetical protein GCM10010259_16590 [Streptomyces daghestanicus]|uniref:Uncharacterized protein n=2 Tax=Streptomyces TaxID=1883 RepID=A0A918GHR0_STRGD|nr:hypothetical protein GCM10010238_28600 [Streptomyces niveoruber]GGS90414.1 hypothetical protein GCM10010240_24770 [Streptomyces griseoviridis]GGU26623.1 hypothetical protein GCM10010259_16590 [Streptomyces daghestanicus]GHI32590.1 hypothetical protein Sdagh_43200 [Streptomyces daghestanicus]
MRVWSPSGRGGHDLLLPASGGGQLAPDAGHRSISVGVYSRAAEVPYVKERRGRAVKKLLLVALAAIGGLLVYRQIQADRAEQDLWTEATDSVPTGS